MYSDIPPRLREVVEPIVADHGLELVDAELAHGPGGPLVRIVVDTRAGDGRVAVERCAELSREIGTGLDADGSFGDRYRLEVSSPGLDRVLAREKDFAVACGREVKVETRRPVDGRRHFRGELLAFEDGVARLRVDGRLHDVPFGEVARARRIYHYTSADFAKKDRGAQAETGEPT
jgi:ribosome maturation factor RimP